MKSTYHIQLSELITKLETYRGLLKKNESVQLRHDELAYLLDSVLYNLNELQILADNQAVFFGKKQ